MLEKLLQCPRANATLTPRLFDFKVRQVAVATTTAYDSKGAMPKLRTEDACAIVPREELLPQPTITRKQRLDYKAELL